MPNVTGLGTDLTLNSDNDANDRQAAVRFRTNFGGDGPQ